MVLEKQWACRVAGRKNGKSAGCTSAVRCYVTAIWSVVSQKQKGDSSECGYVATDKEDVAVLF